MVNSSTSLSESGSDSCEAALSSELTASSLDRFSSRSSSSSSNVLCVLGAGATSPWTRVWRAPFIVAAKKANVWREDGALRGPLLMPPGEQAGPCLADTFAGYRDEIDAFHDRRERLIKTSRDVTALSKKLIFHLHRSSSVATPDELAPLLAAAHTKLREISQIIIKCGMDEGLAASCGAPNDTMNRFERFLGGALEEWVCILYLYRLRPCRFCTFSSTMH